MRFSSRLSLVKALTATALFVAGVPVQQQVWAQNSPSNSTVSPVPTARIYAGMPLVDARDIYAGRVDNQSVAIKGKVTRIVESDGSGTTFEIKDDFGELLHVRTDQARPETDEKYVARGLVQKDHNPRVPRGYYLLATALVPARPAAPVVAGSDTRGDDGRPPGSDWILWAAGGALGTCGLGGLVWALSRHRCPNYDRSAGSGEPDLQKHIEQARAASALASRAQGVWSPDPAPAPMSEGAGAESDRAPAASPPRSVTELYTPQDAGADRPGGVAPQPIAAATPPATGSDAARPPRAATLHMAVESSSPPNPPATARARAVTQVSMPSVGTPAGIPTSPFPRLEIRVVSGPDAGKSFPVADNEITVGRQEDQRIQLSDAAVSRQHALLTVAGGELRVTNLSRGGTAKNGVRIDTTDWKPGDQLRVGGTVLELREAEQP